MVTLVAAPVASSRPITEWISNPYEADKALLLQASKACHMHDGAIYFIQYSPQESPTIHATHRLGDSDAEITCVLQRLPGDLISRYRVDVEATAPPRNISGAARAEHNRVAPNR